MRGNEAARLTWRCRVALGVLALLAVYMISPTLTATHVEGFTAALQVNAIAANRHAIDRADLLYPAQTEYLYLTRQGVVLLLRALMQLTGATGDGLFRALTIASLATFLTATAIVARRHGRVGWGVTLVALLMLPGLFELGFYYSDGIVAVAFGMAGLAVMPAGRSGGAAVRWWARGLLAGIALGIAALCRPDALLLLPLGLGLAWLEQRRLRHLLALAAIAALGLIVALAVAQAVSGTTFVDAVRIGRDFDQMHARIRILWMRLLVLTMFFGIPGLVLVVVGVVRTIRAEPWKRRIVLLVLPGLVVLYAARSATEVRQIYPYAAPFLVLLCARGVEWVVEALRSGRPSVQRRALAVLAGVALVWVLPPVFVPIKDGPRALLGRFWSPPMWRAWQGRIDASLDDVDAIVAEAERSPRLVVVSAHFNSDHYLQLRAWQRGWTPLRVDETAERCTGGVEIWKKGDHALFQIRLDNTYGLSGMDNDDYLAIHLHEALSCPALAGAPTVLTDFWPFLSKDSVATTLRTRMPMDPPMSHSFGWPVVTAPWMIHAWRHREYWVPLQYGINRTVALSPEDVRRVRERVERRVAEPAGRPGEPLPKMLDLAPRFQTRYWTPPRSASVEAPSSQ